MDDARRTLIDLAAAARESLSELSRMLRRNPAYLQQFVQRGSPRRLAEEDRRLLAAHFGIDEARLGGPVAASADVAIPWLGVRAAAGSGQAVDEERVIRFARLPADMLREAGVAASDASLIEAAGDSMSPGILDGDRLLVDRADHRVATAAAIFVFRSDAGLAVKRMARHGTMLTIASDNPDFPTIATDPRDITVVGRVKLLIRTPV